MQWFFALTLLASATLLFLVQPMFAKMVLPKLGGTPMVWNTCMVFYQAALLGGYLYAHLATKWLGTRRQAALHLAILCLPWLVLPIGVAASWTPPGNAPIPWLMIWLMTLMVASVGLPFFVVSASAPMLQAWFADTGHPAGKDPYFLYAASNLGSMAALIAYPLWVEPRLRLAEQSLWWMAGYGVLMVLTVGCAAMLWRSRGAAASAPAEAPPEEEDRLTPAPTLVLRLRWLALAFAPSSLLLGVTTFISTDIAAVPLLWVMPLALYLLTFVIVFARWNNFLQRLIGRWQAALRDDAGSASRGWLARMGRRTLSWLVSFLNPHWFAVRLQPLLVVLLVILFYQSVSGKSAAKLILVHLVAFFVTALVCHGELARSRPKTKYLTEFYIWMSVGGVLGGLFNTLVAPVAFETVIEYPLVVAVACTLRPRPRLPRWPIVARWLDVLIPSVLFFLLAGLVAFNQHDEKRKLFPWVGELNQRLDGVFGRGLEGLVHWVPEVNKRLDKWVPAERVNEWLHLSLPKEWDLEEELLVLVLGSLIALVLQRRPLRFGLAVGMVVLVNYLWYGVASYNRDYPVIYTDRTFFGVVRVKERKVEKEGQVTLLKHTLIHGSTNHGEQRLDPEWRRKPLSYYFPTSPLGQVFDKLIDPVQCKQIGVTGLGTGTTSCYAKAGQTITYFEIDPGIVKMARNTDLFTYLHDAEAVAGAEVKIKLGDARLTLRGEPEAYYDILVMDAFSSDAIPIHLITKEAIELYFEKLKPNGVLMVHISNRHLDLAPVLGNLARELNLVARRCDDPASLEESLEGKFSSDWVLLVRNEKRLGSLADDPHWVMIGPDEKVGVWTDDFSNILTVLNWWKPEESSAEPEEEEPEDE